jgi:hypothetical protein
LCNGTPEQICQEAKSHTGRFLKKELGMLWWLYCQTLWTMTSLNIQSSATG